ncbi:isochorismate synthase [Corynebacterium sp. sy017]|uniref:isochorismate synthase n=1 Tax=unclassified Corynebacterium TaxID=2624378 RepID=UPI001186BE7C|nr:MULTISPECIES: isochorismate synthase [unclassified Corynebacterium]MBP3089272.1 isochorismate synthase [Corynebacterium sp. sy017]QDZ43213.1 isochorismate synthase [Corynebacterium sp. sy039]TSD91023.1 isochorismate synthase [Corynebacterium sp. SY003]
MSHYRPDSAPDFLLSRAHGSVRTQGAKETFDDLDAAIKKLHDNPEEMVVGALPFRRDHKPALTVPQSIIREPGALEPHSYYRVGAGAQLNASLLSLDPSLEEHTDRIAAAIGTIEDSQLKKVVLARSVEIGFDPAVDPRLIAAKLIDLSAARDGFIADLSPAGEDFVGAMLVGSSPEVLVRKQGATIRSFPLAGSAARHSDPHLDQAQAELLLNSSKDNDEHAFVVDHLERLLRPLCSTLEIPAQPQLIRTNEVWHLATPIVGKLKNEHTTALELAAWLHPTPAICGTPTDAAEEVIALAEGDRRFYAGAVGWADGQGNGEYMVAIRCAEVSACGTKARAWAGGGIVAQSRPEDEVAETSAKLKTIMTALGL